MTRSLVLTQPDDAHLHLRDGAQLASLVPHSARRFGRAIVMPNLKPPVVTTAQAAAYRERILAALPPGSRFEPLMTLYLTERTPPEEIAAARASGFVHAVKYYPVGTTTHSEEGVSDPKRVYPVLAAMEKHGLPLLVHGEVSDPQVDFFEREAVFIERVLAPLVREFSGLPVVLEHISTRRAVDFVLASPPRVAATITPQHLLLNRNALFEGGINPHHFCVPVLKEERDRQALLAAATGGNPKFFLGTDSAPHPRTAKETPPGRPGCFTAHAALELYAEGFEDAGALDRLEGFASFHAADFYGLPRNAGSVTLVARPWRVPDTLPLGEGEVVPFRSGCEVRWSLA